MKEARKAFSTFLQNTGLRVTHQRLLILNVFLKSERHLTPEELYTIVKKKDPSVGQATVYRTLKLLSDSGIAMEVDFGDGVMRYEHKFGHDHHDHLICERCKKSIEVVDEKIERLQEGLAIKHGFQLTGHKMYLFGVCSKCKKRGKD